MMSCSYTAACFIIFYLGGLYYKSRRWYKKVNAVAAWIKPSAKQVTAQDASTWIALQICEGFILSEGAPIRFFIHELVDVCQQMPITGQWPVWTSFISHIHKTELLQGSSVTNRYLIIQNGRFTCFHWGTYLHLRALSSMPLFLWTLSALCPGEARVPSGNECFLNLLNFNSTLTPSHSKLCDDVQLSVEFSWNKLIPGEASDIETQETQSPHSSFGTYYRGPSCFFVEVHVLIIKKSKK